MGRKNVTYVDLQLEPEQDQNVDVILEGTANAVKGLVSQLQELVEQSDLTPLVKQTVDLTHYVQKCDGQMLYLRLNLGRLRHAITDAAAPLGAVLLPAVNRAVRDLATLADQVGLVLAALTDSVTGYDSAAQGAQAAAKAQNKYTGAVRATRRSLADFDQLQRLNGSTGGSVSTQTVSDPTALSPGLQLAVSKILALLQPLREIDLTPLKHALKSLGESAAAAWKELGGALEWVWFTLLAPLAKWVTETLCPVLAQDLSGALQVVTAVLQPMLEGLKGLWAGLQPIVQLIGDTAIGVLEEFGSAFQRLWQTVSVHGESIAGIFQNLGSLIGRVWAVIAPILELLRAAFRDTFGNLSQVVSDTLGAVLDALNGVLNFITGIFTGNWQQAWSGLTGFLKAAVNGVIGLLNGMLSGVTAALNAVIRAANKLHFTVPEWVPGVGGQYFGLQLQQVTAPKIPYLARGAVLPANRPFMAVVGDQRHGTNVEAPLATIEQAVLQATAASNGAMVTALQASVGVQQEILEAVLGIHIGDDMIARAVERYNRKMAVVYGSGQ